MFTWSNGDSGVNQFCADRIELKIVSLCKIRNFGQKWYMREKRKFSQKSKFGQNQNLGQNLGLRITADSVYDSIIFNSMIEHLKFSPISLITSRSMSIGAGPCQSEIDLDL